MNVKRRFSRALALFMLGPLTGLVHFVAVYLFGETACAAQWRFEIGGVSGYAFVVLLTTAVAATATVIGARSAYAGRNARHGELMHTGGLLSIVFTIVILMVGIPAIFLEPC